MALGPSCLVRVRVKVVKDDVSMKQRSSLLKNLRTLHHEQDDDEHHLEQP